MKEAYLCLSLHNVYLEKITCCLFYETRHVYSTVLFRSASLTCRQFDMITVCDFSLQGGNLQLAMTFSQTSPRGVRRCIQRPHLFVFFLVCFCFLSMGGKVSQN